MEGDLDRRVSEARAYAKKLVDAWPESENLDQWGPVGLEQYFKSDLSWAQGPHSSYLDGDFERLRPLCELAETDAGCRALVIEIVAERILNDQPLTKDFRRFAYRYLMGELPKSRSKPGPEENFVRDWFLIAILTTLRDTFGLHPTQNDEKDASWRRAGAKASPPSGSAILEECFAAIGQNDLTARAIMEVWKNKKKQNQVQRFEKLANVPSPEVD